MIGSKAAAQASEAALQEDLLLRLLSSVPGVGGGTRFRLAVEQEGAPESSESSEGGPEGPGRTMGKEYGPSGPLTGIPNILANHGYIMDILPWASPPRGSPCTFTS